MKTYVLMLAKHFPLSHKKAGQDTGFKEKVLNGIKIHTIRANYPLWEKRIKEVQKGEAIISLRQWKDKPYKSKQIEISRFTDCCKIGIEKLEISDLSRPGIIEGQAIELQDLAKNDGLEFNDFFYWFKHYDLHEPLAILHFTDYRYNPL